MTATQTFNNVALSALSYNKVAITAPASSSTLTIADGKTLTASNTLTLTGTDSSSVAFGAGGIAAYGNGFNNVGILQADALQSSNNTSGIAIREVNGVYYMRQISSEVLSANRTLFWVMGDAPRVITLGSDLTVANGTFTPTILGASTAGTATYVTQVGRYSKVNDMVTVSGVVAWSAVSSMTGALRIGNLPYAVGGTVSGIASCLWGADGGQSLASGAGILPSIGGAVSSTQAKVLTYNPTAGTAALFSVVSAGSMNFTLTYPTT